MPTSVTVSEVMTKDLFSVLITDSVKDAVDLMEKEKIRHIPILENKKIIGIINEHDLLEYKIKRMYDYDDFTLDDSGSLLEHPSLIRPVEHYLYAEDSVKKAIQLMTRYRLDCLPVIDWDYNIIGLVTSVDLLIYLNGAIPSFSKEKQVV